MIDVPLDSMIPRGFRSECRIALIFAPVLLALMFLVLTAPVLADKDPGDPPPPSDGQWCTCCIPALSQCTLIRASSCNEFTQGVPAACVTTCENCLNPPPPPTGACCRGPGQCAVRTENQCRNNGGRYMGDGKTCDEVNHCIDITPPEVCEDLSNEVSGACCVLGECSDTLTQKGCCEAGGSFFGDGSACRPQICDNVTCEVEITTKPTRDTVCLERDYFGDAAGHFELEATATFAGTSLPTAFRWSVVDGESFVSPESGLGSTFPITAEAAGGPVRVKVVFEPNFLTHCEDETEIWIGGVDITEAPPWTGLTVGDTADFSSSATLNPSQTFTPLQRWYTPYGGLDPFEQYEIGSQTQIGSMCTRFGQARQMVELKLGVPAFPDPCDSDYALVYIEDDGGGGGNLWLDVLEVPQYLFASAEYATPIRFEVRGTLEDVTINSVTAELYRGSEQLGVFDLGHRFVAVRNGVIGPSVSNGQSREYVAYIRASELAAIDLSGELDHTDAARFELIVDVSTLSGASVTLEQRDDPDAEAEVFADRDVFAADLGAGPGAPKDCSFDRTAPIQDVVQLDGEGQSKLNHWYREWLPLPADCNDLDALFQPHDHAHAGWHWGPFVPSHPPGLYGSHRGFEGDTPRIVELNNGIVTKARLWDTQSGVQHGFRARLYGVKRGAYFYVSYGPQRPTPNPLDFGEEGMDLTKTSGQFNLKIFDGGETSIFTDASSNGQGLTHAQFGGPITSLGWALAGSSPLGVTFGVASSLFAYIAAGETPPDPNGHATAQIFRILEVSPPGAEEPIKHIFDSKENFQNGSSYVEAPFAIEIANQNCHVGEQWIGYIQTMNFVSAKSKDFVGFNNPDVDVSSRIEFKVDDPENWTQVHLVTWSQ